MNKKLFASTQFNPKEMRFIDEASKLESRTRANFIYVATLKRAEKIFQASNLDIPDLSEEEDLEQDIQDESDPEKEDEE